MHKVTLIPGDGVGPEVIDATQKIIIEAGAKIEWEVCEAGAAVFKKGLKTGVPRELIESLESTKIALKGPLETPVGYGEKSANVTLRQLFETYGNIRPVRSIPGVKTPYSDPPVDLVIVRENIEDLYAGIEYMQTSTIAQGLKIISHKGCEKIVRLAFEFARSEGRKKVHCATKANILKLTEGMLKRVFEEISKDYPDIKADHIMVDNCAHQLVKNPNAFEVIVMTNMNGDILSDLSSALVGGLGFAPSANIGNDVAIFEAVHGSAPKYVGKNIINPTAALLSGVLMLRRLKEFEIASLIEQAIFVTLSVDKIFTQDVRQEGSPSTTSAYRDAIIRNLGKTFPEEKTKTYKPLHIPLYKENILPVSQEVIGVDIFVYTLDTPEVLAHNLELVFKKASLSLTLKLISSGGTQVYPSLGIKQTSLPSLRCRIYYKEEGGRLSDTLIQSLLEALRVESYEWSQVQKLMRINGVDGFTKAQGED